MCGEETFILSKDMRILIVTSPTGGHFFPAVEVAKKLLDSSKRIIFITQKGNKFIDIIKKEFETTDKVKLVLIHSEKFYRKNPFLLIKLLYYLTLSILHSFIIILKEKPNIVFSTGGYTSFPIIIAAKIFNPFIPVVIHEQNCVLSLTNKFLSLFVSKICLGFNIKKGKKFIFTGNPIRTNLLENINKDKILAQNGFTKEKLTIFIFGGSQGAHSINEAIINFLRKTHNKLQQLIQIVHITGFNDFEYVKEFYNSINIANIVLPFSNEIHIYYSIADIVVSRAGAMTITELIYFKKPAVLIPLPTAAELHQNHNANFLKKYGCAEVVYQRKNWQEKFEFLLLSFITNPEIINKMKQNYSYIPQPQISIETVIQKIYIQKYAKRTEH